ncbi:MAG: zinc ribbon domain-containing protein [Oscillospiraceae bacterium]|nr:zinc ribbon domain-containing protein [Oscillospiraceae bacterium]
MITCPKCNKELEDGTKFCDDCGEQIVETIFCQNCGQQTSTEYAFCQYCGASLVAEQPEEEPKRENKIQAILSKVPKKMLMIGAGALAAVVLVIVILAIALSGGKKNNYILYLKDKEMYFTQVSKLKPWQVTENLVDTDGIENAQLGYAAEYLGSYVQMSKDGKNLFYVDKISDGGMTLYYRSATNAKKEPVKIDSDVSHYQISENGKILIYLKGEEGDLYKHDLKDKEKIATEVSSFYMSKDAKTLIWENEEGDLYMQKGNKDKEKLDSEIGNIEMVSEDFKTVWYVKEGSFYELVLGKDKEKLASDVYSVLAVYESGEFYYLKSDTTEKVLYDYVDDDLAASDAAMTEPVYPEYPTYPDYPYSWNYETYEAYEAAYAEYQKKYDEVEKKYNEDLDKYYAARDEWWAKDSRDSTRESLKNEKIEQTVYTLYYNNGKEDKELTANYTSGSAEYSWDEQILIYGASEKGEVGKMKMSEIESYWDVYNKVTEEEDNASEVYIALKDTVTTVDQTAAEAFWIAENGKAVYFLDNVDYGDEEAEEPSDKEPHGELYKMEISGTKVKKTELYDSDVYYNKISLKDNGKLLYYKNYKNSKGELYLDKEKVADDVASYIYNADSNTVACMTDWNSEKSYGSLKLWKKGKLEKVEDDVHSYRLTPNGELLFIKEYSTKNYKGELYILKGSKAKKIDDDVVAIIPVYVAD